jgi:hypothetical protein
MASSQITIPLTAQERRTLFRIAESECRDPVEQLRFLLRREAQQRGLLNGSGIKVKSAETDRRVEQPEKQAA